MRKDFLHKFQVKNYIKLAGEVLRELLSVFKTKVCAVMSCTRGQATQWQHWPERRNSSHSLITFKHSLMQPSFPYFTKWIKRLFSNLCHSTPPNTHRVSTVGKHPEMATVLMNHIWFSRICTGSLVKKSLTFLKLSSYFSQGHISRPMAMADGKCKQHKCNLKEGNSCCF